MDERRRDRIGLAVTDIVRVERDNPRPGAWRLMLNDPERANALSPALVDTLHASLQAAFAGDARAIILESSSQRFCAGSDLRDVDGLSDAELRARFSAIEDVLETLRRAPTLTIALVRGAALGAGADLVACCDYRIGASDARFAFPGSRFGVVLGTRHLAVVVGRQAAREILIEGKTLDADAAVACGLLSELSDAEAMADRVEKILLRSEGLDPPTLRAVLRLIRDEPNELDRAELLRSTWRGSLADRLREHARRTREERATRRTTGA